MKNNKLAYFFSGLCMLVIIVIICIFSVRSVRKGGPVVTVAEQGELRNTIEIPLSEAADIEVTYTSDNLKIYPVDGETVIIKEYLSPKRPDEELASVNISDGKAVITGGKRDTITMLMWISMNERIEIYLPKDGVQKLEIAVSSGNLSVERIVAETITLATKSGNISAKELSGKAEISAGSGNVTVTEFTGCGSISTKSGNIKVEACEIGGDMSLEAGSGNVKLLLPTDLSFQAELNTGSGNIHTDFDDSISYNKEGNHATGMVGAEPVGMLSLKAGSGNVSLKTE